MVTDGIDRICGSGGRLEGKLADLDFYRFSYQKEDGRWKKPGEGEVRYLTTEVGRRFTGNYIGLYSSGNEKKCRTKAFFTDFSYERTWSGEFLK